MEKRILAKCGRKKAKCGRRKALFGSEEAAILAAAGINAMASAAAATVNANATKDAANTQAKAAITSAEKNAQAIKDQTNKSNESQIKSQDFIKEQNDENRALQKDMQMQLEVLTNQQNVNDRFEAGKLVVKNGGRTKPRYSLRGNNMAFRVTDGGYVVPVGSTPEGYNLFEIKGNDHEHYHKAPGGKNKTGVGIKFEDGNVIEGEGNQNTNQGEYMLQTPDAAYFISKHDIAGFNPAKAVNSGMHPLAAYNIQEQQKQIKGITDDGKKISSPVKNKKKLAGGVIPNVYAMYNQTGPQMGVDTVGDTAVGVAYASQDKNKMKCGGKKRTLKCGGKVRKKAYSGMRFYRNPVYNGSMANEFAGVSITPTVPTGPKISNVPYNPIVPVTSTSPANVNYKSPTTSTTKPSSSFWNNGGTELAGAGISALGNLGGAFITTSANKYAANKLADAYNQAANITADAYRSLQTIDLGSIKRADFKAAHAMPALQAPVSQAASKISGVDRQLQRQLANIRKYSASGAAAQSRSNVAEVDAQDIKNKIYSADQEQMQKIRQDNANRVTQASMQNAQLDTEANKQFTSAYLNLLQYNNDIENQKILGSAGALAEGATNAASSIADAHTANASTWSNAITNSTQGFTNTLSSMATRKADLDKVMLGASGETRSIYYANNGSYTDAKNYYNTLRNQYDSIKDSTDPADVNAKAYLKRRINMIATSRGFDIV